MDRTKIALTHRAIAKLVAPAMGRLEVPDRVGREAAEAVMGGRPAHLDVDVLPVIGEMQAAASSESTSARFLTASSPAARPNRTHANRVRAASCALAFGVRRELLTANPVVGVERQPEQPRDKVLTADEVRAIVVALADETPTMQAYVRSSF